MTGATLDPGLVLRLAAILGLEDKAFVAGGQALNLWAERYAAREPRLSYYAPFTSKDLDYFGSRAAAEKLAKALDGELLLPEFGDATPQTAIVRAVVDGQVVEVDFLSNILGVDPHSLVKEAVELVAPVRTEGGDGTIAIPVMHPLHCLQSRVANVVTLRRSDDTSLRQLNAAPIVLRCYIDELLTDGDVKEAKRTLRALFDYLNRDIVGRQAHRFGDEDPARVISAYRSDKRLDVRFRWFNLRAMIGALAPRRMGAARPK